MLGLDWVNDLFRWFGRMAPTWTVIIPTWTAVKFVKGRKPVLLKTGVHWFWPATTHLETVPIARQAENLRSQTLVTTDDKVVIVSGMIVHEVVDPVRFALSSLDGFVTIKELALTAIHDVVCSMSWEGLKTEQRKGTLDTKLKNATRKLIDDFGVQVVKVMLTDMAPARVYKVVQATSQD